MSRCHVVKLRFYAHEMHNLAFSPNAQRFANPGVLQEMWLDNVYEVRMQVYNGRLFTHDTPYLRIGIVCM